MSVHTRPSVYDKLRPHLDAADLIRRLGLQESRTIGSESYCQPLCHDSSSGESLQVNLHTGRWNCKSCQSAGVYGDLFQLVEYSLTGGRAPSRGNAQGGSGTHREAIVWLCEQFGIPFDENKVSGDAGLDAVHLFAMMAHRHLLDENDPVLNWISEKWGFDRATIESYGIGFMPSPILAAIATEAGRPASRGAFKQSGLGWHTAEGRFCTRFEGRVTFPYLEHGRAVYLIGRETPWTPALDSGARSPKYHKLSVHSDTRPYISERVTNDHLYNEPVMSSADSVVVAEGVADAVALSALGVPVVSPVTISFNKTDLERFTRKARESNLDRVEILFDNELSGSGNWAAKRAGLQLVERGIVTRILTLPLGDDQRSAKDEVVSVLGEKLFVELEESDPRKRKEIIDLHVPEEARRAWVLDQVKASKIDAAEWCAQTGAGAPGKFNEIRRNGVDVVDLEIAEIAKRVDADDDATARAGLFSDLIALVAHITNRLARQEYASRIARAAGAGVTKVEIGRRIAEARKLVVTPKRKAESDAAKQASMADVQMTVLPPEIEHSKPATPPPPTAAPRPGAPPVPPPPGQKVMSSHDRYAVSRDCVATAVSAKASEESVGQYVAQIVTRSMGFTPFRTPDELYLVRGNERVPVGLVSSSPSFRELLVLASGLTPRKSSHGGYIAFVVYFLGLDARKADDVSWSFVENGAVFFPTGNVTGSILKIEPGKLTKTKMSSARVPAVAGIEFTPFDYVEDGSGIERAFEIFRWTSISKGDRMILIYWLVCLPILRRVGTVPIVRIQGGSSSGKTRTVDAVSYLVNGRKGSSVPTAPALMSRMSTEMLTIDDNRETGDVSPALLGTLLQATHLGAREKRKSNSDTGTVVERICGAVLMNGIEPIHDGRSELASRMLTLRCSKALRRPESPSSEGELTAAMLACRPGFWSESARRCSVALEMDAAYGDAIGAEIERLFGVTQIGRLSSYLRLMYMAWVAGLSEDARTQALVEIAPEWRSALESIGTESLESLLTEELAVTVVRYVFAFGMGQAEPITTASDDLAALEGKFVHNRVKGDTALGPLRAQTLARFARMAGKAMNAPLSVAASLRSGQLEQRLMDGLEFLRAAGFEVSVEQTRKGRRRFTFYREGKPSAEPPAASGGDTWVCP